MTEKAEHIYQRLASGLTNGKMFWLIVPQRMNTMDFTLLRAFIDLLEEARKDTSVAASAERKRADGDESEAGE